MRHERAEQVARRVQLSHIIFMLFVIAALLTIVVLQTGCAHQAVPVVVYKTVSKPVPVRVKMHPALTKFYAPKHLPVFYPAPPGSGFSSCLKPDDEHDLITILRVMRARESAVIEYGK